MRSQKAIVVQAADVKAANAALQRQGYGPDMFSVQLLPAAETKADAAATHYGCSWSATDADMTVVQQALTRAGIAFRVRSQSTRTFDTAISVDGHKQAKTVRELKAEATLEQAIQKERP